MRDAFERFITCELTTVDADKQPITWPVTPYYRQGGPTIDVTTGLGYPKKADDARRHPRIALLFSDPTGSGLEGGQRVLVQGTATVDDEDLKANARALHAASPAVKLPATKKMYPPKPIRGMFNWYYARIYIKVRPERVFVWPGGTWRSRRSSTMRTWRRCAPATSRSRRRTTVGRPGDPGVGQAHGRPGRARHGRAQLDGAGWVPDRGPRPVQRGPLATGDRHRGRAGGAASAGGTGLPDRAPARARLHLAAQHAGPRRPRRARSGAGAWCRAGSSAGFELPEGRLTRFRDFIRKGPGFYLTYRRRLRER